MSVLFICGMIVSCATPIAPSGGPPDKEGPVVEFTKPETGTTNYDGRKFEFQFNEFVDRASAAKEITVEPELFIPYKIDWKRKKMTLEFEEELPDSTTVIITLGPGLSDTRNNKSGDPVTLAISTGDEIDTGKIAGRILQADNGKGAKEKKVLLYRTPVDYSSRANYQAVTDTGGVFEFSYLREGTYQALMVDDRNRNKIWDQQSETAQPFSKQFITLAKDSTDTLDVIYSQQQDTLKPDILGVGLLSTQRMRLRFSEGISYKDSLFLNIQDSSGTPYSSAYPLYIPQKDNFVLMAKSEKPLMEGHSYTLLVEGITDLAGNELTSGMYEFTGSAQEDTTKQRVISANDINGIAQKEAFRVHYATDITQQVMVDSVVVIEGDVDFDDWPEIEVRRNELMINPQEQWIEGVDYQFLVWNPMTQRRKIFKPEVWDSTDYAQIDITINSPDSTHEYTLKLLSPEGKEVRKRVLQHKAVLAGLPPIPYTLIIYRDRNENGSWDSGTVIPYKAPEPYYIQHNISMQRGFTSEIKIEFN
ncbi:MAG: hypothetical protein FH748_03540 [Balneolaceae bacterium]|nr:hypothetical protein [Balneolaceae bacterium]